MDVELGLIRFRGKLMPFPDVNRPGFSGHLLRVLLILVEVFQDGKKDQITLLVIGGRINERVSVSQS